MHAPLVAPVARERGPLHETESTAQSIVVVFAADENYSLPLSVTLYSTLYHFSSDRELRVVVLDAGITAGTKERLQAVVNRVASGTRIEWVTPDTSDLGAIDRELEARYTDSALYRLLIPDIFPDLEKVIYLDSDLVVHANIAHLWDEQLDGASTLAVQERTVSCPVAGVAEWEALGFASDAAYMNTGVLVMDLVRWRAEDIHTRTMDYLMDPDRQFLQAYDQEALNAVLCGEWKALDPRWNALYYSSMEIVDEAYVHHFAGAHPWLADWRHPGYTTFFTILKRSGWFSPSAFALWTLKLRGQRSLNAVKDLTRPVRHWIGLRRQVPAME